MKDKRFIFSKGTQSRRKSSIFRFYAVIKTTILTPANDRFPAQASDLKLSKFSGFSAKN